MHRRWFGHYRWDDDVNSVWRKFKCPSNLVCLFAEVQPSHNSQPWISFFLFFFWSSLFPSKSSGITISHKVLAYNLCLRICFLGNLRKNKHCEMFWGFTSLFLNCVWGARFLQWTQGALKIWKFWGKCSDTPHLLNAMQTLSLMSSVSTLDRAAFFRGVIILAKLGFQLLLL